MYVEPVEAGEVARREVVREECLELAEAEVGVVETLEMLVGQAEQVEPEVQVRQERLQQ
jgi:hypothetical protein